MIDSLPWQQMANAVLLLHVAIVLFVIVGLPIILVGNLLHWRWVNAWWFRLLHIATIVVVVAEALLGIVCPLTTLEMYFRARSRTTIYAGGFMEHWVEDLLFYNGPQWVFTLCYCLFGLAVVGTWWRFPPRMPRRKAHAACA